MLTPVDPTRTTVSGTSAAERYEGPNFEEFCISEAAYLPATRDRTPCLSCCLEQLCQAGFDEQVARAERGENPSLTEGRDFADWQLEREHLLRGLTDAQVQFLEGHIPNL